MLRVYRCLLRLYPEHVRVIYGQEMLAAFASRLESSASSPLAACRLLLREIVRIAPDGVAERIAALSSHASFHGRRPSDLGIVRPPNVGKAEWFYAGQPPSRFEGNKTL